MYPLFDDKMTDFFKLFTGFAAAVWTSLFGGAEAWLWALMVFVALDYITGVAAAYINRELDSNVGFRGILKKLLLFALVATAVILDRAAGMNGMLRNIVLGTLVANEGLSILENCARAGVPIPESLRLALKQLGKRGGRKADCEKNDAGKNDAAAGKASDKDGDSGKKP